MKPGTKLCKNLVQEMDNILPLIGKLRYLIDNSRPDLIAALGILSDGAHLPTIDHYQAAKDLLKYLGTMPSLGIRIGGHDKNVLLTCFCDASGVQMMSDSKSRLASASFISTDSGVIEAIGKKDITVSHHTTEAETKAIDLCVRRTVSKRQLLDELGFPQNNPTKIYTDSASAKQLCDTENLINEKSRHIQSYVNYIREQINLRIIELIHIPGQFNVADILTKALPPDSFKRHQHTLMQGFSVAQAEQDNVLQEKNA